MRLSFADGKPLFGQAGDYGLLNVVSMLAWGLGYFGMPQVLLRFIAIRRADELKMSRRIAMVWVTISLIAAVAIGTKHLTVFGDCLAALAPRGYVVGLHFFNFKMFAAFRADTLLTLICSTRHFGTECTNA